MAAMKTDLACTGKVSIRPVATPYMISWLMGLLLAEADEAYVIGKRGQYTPVQAYLAGDEIIKIAVLHGAQMIHPGRIEIHS